MVICYINFLKLGRDDASFPSAERSFQAFAPLEEKHFWLALASASAIQCME